jgi:hypothetical protein
VAQAPEDSLFRTQLAKLLLRLKRFDECLATLDDVASRGTGLSTEWRVLKARTLAEAGRRDDARRALEGIEAGGEGVLDGEARAEALLSAAELGLEVGLDPAAIRGLLGAAASLPGTGPGGARARWVEARLALDAGGVARALEVLAAMPERDRAASAYRRLDATARGLGGDLRFAARELMDLIRRDPGDLESFRAFRRVFAEHAADPQVKRVLELAAQAEARHAAYRSALERLAGRSLEQSGELYRELSASALAAGERETALDCLYMAAALEDSSTVALDAIAAMLAPSRSDLFERLHVLGRILARDPQDRGALEATAGLYLDLGVRLDEAERLARVLDRSPEGREAATALLERLAARRGR